MGKRTPGKHKKSSKHARTRDGSSSSTSSSSSLSSIDEKTKRKLKKKIKKLRKKEKQKKKAEKKALKKLVKNNLKEVLKEVKKTEAPSSSSCDVDVSLMEKSKSLAPMTKEEWEKQQNTFRRVFDEETGRTREMTLTVHGFPSDIAALRFEWAWQHPTRSRRLKSLIKKKKNSETSFQYYLKVMFTMLRVPPWCRLPLTLRWLSADVMVDPPPNLAPPMHMPIVYGPVVSKKLNSPKKKKFAKTTGNSQDTRDEDEEELSICKLCHEVACKKESLTCLKNECGAKWHVICLAKHFLEREHTFAGNHGPRGEARNVLPLEGPCSECDSVMLWGDLVRKKNGCYSQEGRSEHTEHSSSENTISDSPLGKDISLRNKS